MEFKKEYFPRAEAPDIAKKTIMQYVYWNKKNLSKRFYFYRVYAPAFLLLFIVWWWMTYYNKANKPDLEIYTFNNDAWVSNEFVENMDIWQKTVSIVPEDTIINNNETLNNNIDTKDTAIDNSIWNIAMKSARWVTEQVGLVNTLAVDNQQKTLDQQINEIEILMDDISSITSQEEILF